MQIRSIIAHTYVLFTLTAGLSLEPVSSLYLSLRLRSYIRIPGMHRSKDSIPPQNPILLPPQSYEELLG